MLIALIAGEVSGQGQVIFDNEVVEPRTYGYVIGDRIRREVRLVLRADYRLDEAGLPSAGRLDRWLELAEPEVAVATDDERREYRLAFTYQVVNAPVGLQTIDIPQMNLDVLGPHGAPTLTTLVPAVEVTIAPLVGDDPITTSSLQPDREPSAIPTEAQEVRLAWAVAACLALLVMVAARRGATDVLARRRLPFAIAARELRRIPTDEAVGDAAAMKVVHNAINRTAGRAVFAHNLDGFLQSHPRFAEFRADFERLFEASGQTFFERPDPARVDSIRTVLVRLCRSCQRMEWPASRPTQGRA